MGNGDMIRLHLASCRLLLYVWIYQLDEVAIIESSCTCEPTIRYLGITAFLRCTFWPCCLTRLVYWTQPCGNLRHRALYAPWTKRFQEDASRPLKLGKSCHHHSVTLDRLGAPKPPRSPQERECVWHVTGVVNSERNAPGKLPAFVAQVSMSLYQEQLWACC